MDGRHTGGSFKPEEYKRRNTLMWTATFDQSNIDQLNDPAVNLLLNIMSGLDPKHLTDDEVELMVAKFGEDIRKDLRP